MKTCDTSKVNIKKIKNIVFDWGGVIINLNYKPTIEAFNKLGFKDFSAYFQASMKSGVFLDLEIGTIDGVEIRNSIRKELNLNFSDEDFDNAWCAMLLNTPDERINLLQSLSKNFHIFLLSNTNIIHEKKVMNRYSESGIDFFSLFKKVYLSHWLAMRKPNLDIFQHVIDDNKLVPSETLFIDDTEEHVDTADRLGYNAFHLKPGLEIQDLFKIWLG